MLSHATTTMIHMFLMVSSHTLRNSLLLLSKGNGLTDTAQSWISDIDTLMVCELVFIRGKAICNDVLSGGPSPPWPIGEREARGNIYELTPYSVELIHHLQV